MRKLQKELLTIRNSKISRYLVIRSTDCTLEIIEKVFNPQMYSNGELQEIARVANSNKILEMIFEHVKCNIGKLVPQNGWKAVHNSNITKMILKPNSIFCKWSKNYEYTAEIDIKNKSVKTKWENNN